MLGLSARPAMLRTVARTTFPRTSVRGLARLSPGHLSGEIGESYNFKAKPLMPIRTNLRGSALLNTPSVSLRSMSL